MSFTAFLSALTEYLKFQVHGILITSVYKLRKKNYNERLNFYTEFLKPGDLCYDVGANLGNRTEVFLGLKCRVLALEPQTFCYQYLKLRFGKAITLLKKAASDKQGSGELFLSDSSTLSSVSSTWIETVKKTRFHQFNWRKTEKIEFTTLDELIRVYGAPHFIKIDVEGHEAAVLKGLHTQVPVISFEYTTPECSGAMFECLAILQRINPEYLYNFSSGEENKFQLKEWMNYKDFSSLLRKEIGLLRGFGDIYARDC